MKLDNDWEINRGSFHQIYSGIYYADREKRREAYRTPWGGVFGGYQFDLPDTLFIEVEAPKFLPTIMQDVWFGFDPDEYIQYLWSEEFIQREVIDTGYWLADTNHRKESGRRVYCKTFTQ